MIWIFVIGIVGFILLKFLASLSRDNYELDSQSLSDKFGVIVTAINNAAFNGRGSVTVLDKRRFNLYEEGQNQIINFQYSTGSLTITWRYKYFQKEVVHRKDFNEVRNLSIFEQQSIANRMISEMQVVIEDHKRRVISQSH